MRVSPSITLAGYFWLPTQPEKKLPGTLVIADGGTVKLDVIGSFYDGAAVFTAPLVVERISGHVESHGYATLEKCIVNQRNISFGGISKCSFHAHVLFLGVGYEPGEAPQFNSLHFGVEGLDQWHDVTGLRRELNPQENTAAISYRRPDAIDLWSDQDVTLSLRFLWSVPGTDSLTEATVKQESYLSLHSEKLQPLDYFLRYAHKLVHFLSFSVDETVSIRDVSLRTSVLMDEGPGGQKYQHKIGVYYESLLHTEKPEKIERHSLLFNFSAIQASSREVLRAWLAAHERLMPSMNLYFSAQAGAHSYLNSRFLSVSQAVETYHRRTFDDTNLPPADFAVLLQTLLQATPVLQRELVESRLKYANEPSLRVRLRQLVGNFSGYFGEPKAQKAFIDQVVTTRNYFTHYNEHLAKGAAHGQALWELCSKLEALYQLQLMKEIGFSDAMITGIVKENWSLRAKLNLPAVAPAPPA